MLYSDPLKHRHLVGATKIFAQDTKKKQPSYIVNKGDNHILFPLYLQTQILYTENDVKRIFLSVS